MMVASAVPVSMAAWVRSSEGKLHKLGKKERDGVELTVVSLPPSKGPFSDEVVENETKNEPKRILG